MHLLDIIGVTMDNEEECSAAADMELCNYDQWLQSRLNLTDLL